jgi:hydroxylamine reductase
MEVLFMAGKNAMFCFQCQETMKGTGCTIAGVCGKHADTASLQDLLLYTVKGVSIYSSQLRKVKPEDENLKNIYKYIINSLFITITNANFDNKAIIKEIRDGVELRNKLRNILVKNNLKLDEKYEGNEIINWNYSTEEELIKFSKKENIGVLSTENIDVRSLRELLIYGLKGIAAYTEHAYDLGKINEEILIFVEKGLLATLSEELSTEELTNMVLTCGNLGVKAMALLDEANTSAYGNPEITKVKINVGTRPGILISGHDLRDLEQLLEQSKDSGVDIYTHSEMLPGHYYPKLKKYSHFYGNYGNAWWKQKDEFETFNGPIVFTTNCIVPPSPKANYNDRVFTTNAAGFPGWKRIPVRENGTKDFSQIIEVAKGTKPPTEIEKGEIIGGFAHNQVISLADKIVENVKSGAIKRFIVMAGCDGRMPNRSYYTDFAKALPKDTIILTAGCAKYRYNKLDLGDINGIPRVLDAGQCNDSYSLVLIALKLKEAFGLDDINDLPLIFNIAWYEQNAVIVLLALLSLGVQNIHVGPTLPAFLSPNVAEVLVKNFGLAAITDVENDLKIFGLNY